ncbi:MAG: hypothetical protein KQI35_11965 [Bacteroidetes bacterium]|nr:hypothetical protein [Bacteroidota bacterium]
MIKNPARRGFFYCRFENIQKNFTFIQKISIMELTYICPHCKGAINAKRNIILAARSVKEKDNKGLVLLHEEIGNYAVAISSTLKVDSGDEVDFSCPICHSSLNSPKGDSLASFIRIENNEESNIVISRIYGERCTFQIDDKKKIKSYGESVSKFVDPEWFL